MVNWKAPESLDRLVGALIAAHPGLKLDYQAMAVYFGQGSTYDAIEGRFRRFRKVAEELKTEAAGRGITTLPRGRNSGPRTPRTPGGGISKPSSSGRSTARAKNKGLAAVLDTPTKKGGRAQSHGQSVMNAILVGDSASEDENNIKTEGVDFLSGLTRNEKRDSEPAALHPIKFESSNANGMMMGGFVSSVFGEVKQESRPAHTQVPTMDTDTTTAPSTTASNNLIDMSTGSSTVASTPAALSATTPSSASFMAPGCGIGDSENFSDLDDAFTAQISTGLCFTGYDIDDLYGGVA
ncbi:hypothetical protein P168DRAFT_281120 [Aspergillus campestris IBT 28561]|uniref:Uncharacterized protein n=1 Tax=Aspergillus campestris (strain IBT 28561) TaxID=1392248 RepID=A0A2I1D4E6_ASPC2|nr:uncharacterized protein P168DRAFT_281120 [Aspergillus campestris IBT 28561]PKY04743.1 hypothetical protein P168DRAFT_281120 [Aspergillus campestris IBT 28561]